LTFFVSSPSGDEVVSVRVKGQWHCCQNKQFVRWAWQWRAHPDVKRHHGGRRNVMVRAECATLSSARKSHDL
jgi:hypothetical protein